MNHDLTLFERVTIRDWALADVRSLVDEARERSVAIAGMMDECHGGWYHDLTRSWPRQHCGRA